MKTRQRYYVETWDIERQRFTPQEGVRTGPYSMFGLRKALRALRGMGYPATRLPRVAGDGTPGDCYVLVESR